MTLSRRTCQAILLLCTFATIGPAVASAQSASDPTAPAPAPAVFRTPLVTQGQYVNPLQEVQVLFGVWDEGSQTSANVAAMWTLNFYRVYIGWKPAPAISYTARPVQGTKTGPSSTLDVGITAEGGVTFSNTTGTYAGGPRATFVPSGWRLAIYGEVLAGGLSFDGGTDFLLMPAAGVKIPIGDSKFSIAGEIGFPIDYFDGGHQGGTRYMGGITYRLGK